MRKNNFSLNFLIAKNSSIFFKSALLGEISLDMLKEINKTSWGSENVVNCASNEIHVCGKIYRSNMCPPSRVNVREKSRK